MQQNVMSGTRNKHAPAEWQGWSLPVASFLSIGMALAASGCSSVPLREAGSLSSYSRLGPEEGRVAKSRSFADRSALLSATTVSIQPARLGPAAAARVHDAEQERLVSNALDRALCIGLSDRFRVVGPGERADLTVRSTITDIVPTGTWAAGVSKVATLGTSAVLPVGLPRLPIGLGGLAVEAEAVDAGGAQRAAILWSHGIGPARAGPIPSPTARASPKSAMPTGWQTPLQAPSRRSWSRARHSRASISTCPPARS
ncbi:Protein of unknown function [Rhizobium sp. RU35A]|nr:Protein of unknown function [Rhizobium sp. RU35A]